MTDVSAEVEARANELYWQSDESVNQIAEDLSLSKGALYGLIQPLPAGLACPECGDDLLYPNRTARSRGMVGCPSCGFEGDEEETPELAGSDGPGSGGSLLSAWDGMSAERKRTMIGGALVGAAAGLALVFWARSRSEG